jgi:AraC-like DNA-binding protein
MTLCRPAHPALAEAVEQLWATDGDRPSSPGRREAVLPGGAVHLVIRLGEEPLRLFPAPDAAASEAVGTCVAGGVRTRAYHKEVAAPAPSVGVLLRPGALEPLSGAPAAALGRGHLNLEDLWPRPLATELRERLAAAATPPERLALLEDFLLRESRPEASCDPLVVRSAARLRAGAPLAAVVQDSGYSHRHFARRFEAFAGVPPKAFARMGRFARVLDGLRAAPTRTWADLSAEAGYADQAHLCREFKEIAGLTPERYRRRAAAGSRHVPL